MHSILWTILLLMRLRRSPLDTHLYFNNSIAFGSTEQAEVLVIVVVACPTRIEGFDISIQQKGKNYFLSIDYGFSY